MAFLRAHPPHAGHTFASQEADANVLRDGLKSSPTAFVAKNESPFMGPFIGFPLGMTKVHFSDVNMPNQITLKDKEHHVRTRATYVRN